MSGNESDIGDFGNLDALDFEQTNKRVEELRDAGGEVLEASDDCEGGACKL